MSQAGQLNEEGGGLDNLVIQTALGSASPIGGTLIFGGNVIISAGGNTVNFNAILSDVFPWVPVTTSQTMASNTGYIVQGSSTVSLMLPATSNVGDEIDVILASSTANWIITMNGSQQIRVGTNQSSLGGTVASKNVGDSVNLVCTVANTNWQAYSNIGTFTYS